MEGRRTMMSCREVSTMTLQGPGPDDSRLRRAQAWLHRAMCRHCGRFWRQVRAVDRGLLAVLGRLEQEAPADLEDRIVQRVSEATSGDQ
jgi:hypothetical protein